MGSGEGVPVTVEFRNGTTITALIPEEDITIPSGETGAMTVNVSYMGKTVAVNIFVSPSAPGTDPEEDPSLINSATKFKRFMNGSDNIEEAIITGSFSVDFNNEPWTVSNVRLYSSSPENTVTITGLTYGNAILYLEKVSNVEVSGFTIKDGREHSTATSSDAPKPMIKLENASDVIFKNMRFETVDRGIDFNPTTNCGLVDCTITKTQRNYGEVQFSSSTGLKLTNLTIEGDAGMIACDDKTDNVSDLSITGTVNVAYIYGSNGKSFELTSSNPEYTQAIPGTPLWTPAE